AWVVTSPATTQARIRATWTSNTSVSDVSDADFSIAAAAITVTAPNGSGSLWIATSFPITFVHNLGVGQPINLDVSRNGGLTWSPIARVTPTADPVGMYSWVLTAPVTTQARVRATWASNPTVTDSSDVNFTIGLDTTKPTIGVSFAPAANANGWRNSA